jgi:predicted DNA-binding ribbon-helix-helix protein
LINRNVVSRGGRTSMRLEPELWDALLEVCEREGKDPSALVRGIEVQSEAIGRAGGRTSAVRVYLMAYYRAAATETGHIVAGHGKLARARVGFGARHAA